MTYEDLQLLSQVAPDTIARARDGRIATCKLATLEKLASALDVDISDLFHYVQRVDSSSQSGKRLSL